MSSRPPNGMVKSSIEYSGLLITRTLHRYKHQLRDFFNISNDAGRVKGLGTVGFMISYTLITSAQTHCFPSRSNQPCFFVDLYPTAWLGPVRLHHCGGVAHQTSLRSR